MQAAPHFGQLPNRPPIAPPLRIKEWRFFLDTRRRVAGLLASSAVASHLAKPTLGPGNVAGPHGITVCPVPGLMNICFGDLEGLSVDVAHGLFPVEHEAWMRDPWSARIASWLLPRP